MKFLSALRAEQVEDVSADGRGTWRLLEPLRFVSDLIGAGEVPADFLTDFASVPRLPVVFFLAGGLAHRAAIVHDYLYTTHSTTRDTADSVFREALAACGISPWRAYFMWLGVRAGGAAAWDAAGPEQKPEVAIQIQQEALLP